MNLTHSHDVYILEYGPMKAFVVGALAMAFWSWAFLVGIQSTASYTFRITRIATITRQSSAFQRGILTPSSARI